MRSVQSQDKLVGEGTPGASSNKFSITDVNASIEHLSSGPEMKGVAFKCFRLSDQVQIIKCVAAPVWPS